jgi:hypothetical protein
VRELIGVCPRDVISDNMFIPFMLKRAGEITKKLTKLVSLLTWAVMYGFVMVQLVV